MFSHKGNSSCGWISSLVLMTPLKPIDDSGRSRSFLGNTRPPGSLLSSTRIVLRMVRSCMRGAPRRHTKHVSFPRSVYLTLCCLCNSSHSRADHQGLSPCGGVTIRLRCTRHSAAQPQKFNSKSSVWGVGAERHLAPFITSRVGHTSPYPLYTFQALTDIRHCADAVLSLANDSTVVGEVATGLADFAARWVQSPSSYNLLVANQLKRDWVTAHRPVLSTKPDTHILYTGFSYLEPRGQFVVCPGGCCDLRYRSNKNTIRIICDPCRLRCSIHKTVFHVDSATPLGRVSILKVSFPQTQYPTPTWNLEGTEGQTHPLPLNHSSSQSGLPVSAPKVVKPPKETSPVP